MSFPAITLTTVALLGISAVGALLGLWIAVLLFRLNSLRRLRTLLSVPALDHGTRAQPFALGDVEGPARNLVALAAADSGASFVLLFLPHQGDDRLSVAVGEGDFEPFTSAEFSYYHPIVRRLEAEGQPVELGDSQEERGLPAHTLLFPMLARERLIALLAVGPRKGHPPSARTRAMIQLAILQAAAPLENAQLYTSLRRAFSELEAAQRELLALQRVGVAAQSTLKLDEVLAQIELGVTDGLALDSASVYLVDEGTQTLSIPAPRGTPAAGSPPEAIPFDESNPTVRALLAGEVYVTHDVRESMLPPLIEAGALRARDLQHEPLIMNVPLVAQDRTIGGMVLTTRRSTFSEQQVESLRAFAAQAAATIENARLYGRLETAYSDLRTAQEQLIRAERLRTLGQVASGVAHDFNNILAAILTRAQLAQQQTRSPALRQGLQVIEQAALDGARVTHRIQSLGRSREEREPELLDLNGIVQQALELTRPMWMNAAQARAVSVRSETAFAARASLQGHPSELREVFTNLILNATAAMPNGGELRLRTYEQSGWVWCEVEDTGAGMPEAVKRQIFDPFFTTKGAAGSGLGMSIVAAILERHGGRIEIDSEPGKGTTVRVAFPVAGGQPVVASRRRRRGRASLRLLVVEEDERTRDALALILARNGHRVQTADDAESAVRTLAGDEVDLVITDLGLGDHSGWEVAEATRAVRPDAAVVLLTAWPNEWPVEESRARGVDAILAKPFTVDEVLACLEHALVGNSVTGQ